MSKDPLTPAQVARIKRFAVIGVRAWFFAKRWLPLFVMTLLTNAVLSYLIVFWLVSFGCKM